jgi:hypothetical protein
MNDMRSNSRGFSVAQGYRQSRMSMLYALTVLTHSCDFVGLRGAGKDVAVMNITLIRIY